MRQKDPKQRKPEFREIVGKVEFSQRLLAPSMHRGQSSQSYGLKGSVT